MRQNSNSFLSAITAFFGIAAESQKTESESVYRVCAGDPNGLSGVAKYLQSQETLLAKQNAERLEKLAAQAAASGVAKYLDHREQKSPMTSVARYALRQAIAERQAQKENPALANTTTGVDKYLRNRKAVPVISGVEKYLKRQEALPQPSKVAKYMAKVAREAKSGSATTQAGLTGVAKYLQHQASLPQPSKVARYMAKQAVLAALQAKSVVPDARLTGVASYLKHQETLPQPSKVAKYMARQAFLDAQQTKTITVKRSETGVDKYVKYQDTLPQPSKVAKYMARQTLAEQHKPVETVTGVEKYMREQG